MASISLDNIRKVYGGSVEAVKGISLDIADGDLVVLVGPSGCGKSTLLRMVAGLEEITSGTLKIGERVVNRMEPAERDIAMVFQNYALYPHMTVYNNLAYGLKNRGQSKQEIDRRVQEAAKMLEIGDFLDRKPRQLSGGQRQRVAMGRALVREPAAFLFDEPLSNLDAKLRVQMRVEIKALQKRLKTTSLYVTHDQVEAMTLADTLVVMNGGVAEQIGRPIDIYNRPETVFVAEFIGSPSMNLLEAEGSAGDTLTLAGGQTVTIASSETKPEAGRRILFGVRPEHLRLAESSPPDLHMTVNAVETLGADTMAHGTLAGANNGRTARLIARLSGGASIAEGDRLPLCIEPGLASIFDAQTGRRLAPTQ